MLIHPSLGSFFLLGALLLDLPLEPDIPFPSEHCGTCRRCIDACPTAAIVAPGVLDARQCLSYVTIELRDAIPHELRARMGALLFGCDICQDCCPWNVRFARERTEPAFAPRPAIADKDARTLARELLAMSPAQFSTGFRGSPLKRARLTGLKRNAAVALGNAGDVDDVPALRTALQDPESLVREHARWALERIQTRATSPAEESASLPSSPPPARPR
jgi:epoxyqueuosine reductase